MIGLKRIKARAKIRARRCRVGTITRKPSSPAKKGCVLAQRPRAGRILRRGAKVSLKVGRGPS